MTVLKKTPDGAADLLDGLTMFFKSLLAAESVDALLVPRHLPEKNVVMPVLISDPEQVESIDPLSPSFPMNAAKLVSKLTRKAVGGRIAAVMRPCEIRAFVELVKLKQGRFDDLLLIGVDCLGAYTNKDYSRAAGEDGRGASKSFYKSVLSGAGTAVNGFDLAEACRICEKPVPENVDIHVELFGIKPGESAVIRAASEAGAKLLDGLDLENASSPAERVDYVAALVEQRTRVRDEVFERMGQTVNSLEKLSSYLASCVNCYNCRVACPVCYCRECVFTTDVFDHDPSQYLKWSERKGAIKMPTDTTFYHLTRLAHMSTACVGCGQCSNACPNDIPVMELFRTVAHRTQNAFDYQAGRSVDEEPPLSVFREDEYPEVTGGRH